MAPKRRKRAFLTGASSGIGACTAKLLLREGYDLALLARRQEALETLRLFAAVAGGKVLVLPLDLADREATDEAIRHVREHWSSLDAVILNAGANGVTPLEGPSTQLFDHIMEVNLVGHMRLLRGLVDTVSTGGRIVAVSSVLGRVGVPGLHGYGASKAALVGFMKALALELAPRRITANAILPGWVETPMALEAIAEQAPAMGLKPSEARQTFLGQVPLGRMLEAGEVARLVLYLLSSQAGGMTGQALSIDGGVTA